MRDCENAVFSQIGITSWGCAWEWTFDSGVELKAPDGHTLMVTDLNTRILEYNFEDELFDRSFSMSQVQDTEWGADMLELLFAGDRYLRYGLG